MLWYFTEYSTLLLQTTSSFYIVLLADYRATMRKYIKLFEHKKYITFMSQAEPFIIFYSSSLWPTEQNQNNKARILFMPQFCIIPQKINVTLGAEFRFMATTI